MSSSKLRAHKPLASRLLLQQVARSRGTCRVRSNMLTGAAVVLAASCKAQKQSSHWHALGFAHSAQARCALELAELCLSTPCTGAEGIFRAGVAKGYDPAKASATGLHSTQVFEGAPQELAKRVAKYYRFPLWHASSGMRHHPPHLSSPSPGHAEACNAVYAQPPSILLTRVSLAPMLRAPWELAKRHTCNRAAHLIWKFRIALLLLPALPLELAGVDGIALIISIHVICTVHD